MRMKETILDDDKETAVTATLMEQDDDTTVLTATPSSVAYIACSLHQRYRAITDRTPSPSRNF